MHRKSEDNSDMQAGLGPKLLHVNKWVRAEASKQREHLAAGKTKDGKEKGKLPTDSVPAYSWTGTGGTSEPVFHSTSVSISEAAVGNTQQELLVECLGCGTLLPWEDLEAADGRCQTCTGPPNNETTSSSSCIQSVDVAALNATGSGECNSHSTTACDASPASEAGQANSNSNSASSWRNARRRARMENS